MYRSRHDTGHALVRDHLPSFFLPNAPCLGPMHFEPINSSILIPVRESVFINLVCHFFGGTKNTIWLALLCAFCWSLWGERNRGLFYDSFSSSSFMELVLSTVFIWCKK